MLTYLVGEKVIFFFTDIIQIYSKQKTINNMMKWVDKVIRFS